MTSSGPLGLPNYHLVESKEHVITVSYSDGRTDEFYMKCTPDNQVLTQMLNTTVSFTPKDGVYSQLTSFDDNNCWVMSGSTGYELLNNNFGIYDPVNFKLTTQDGTEYIINKNTGVKSITEPNGNTITFEKNGIFHSAGKSVIFTRDDKGRITEITDPMEKSIKYMSMMHMVTLLL